MSDKAPGPDTPCAWYDEQKGNWKMADDLLAGTNAMRAGKFAYLPKWPNETMDNWTLRCDRAVLLNYFKRTITGLVGKPFSKPLTIPENVSPDLEELFEDVDRQGHSLDMFAMNTFKIGLAKGMVHILVDMPVKSADVKTLQDQKEANLTPYMMAIDPNDLIAAYSEFVDGVEVLTHVRIKECVVEKDGWGETRTDRVRVLEPGTWQIWTKQKNNEYVKTDEGESGLDYIPLVTWYCERESFMKSRGPLVDLAFLNVAHWQSASDQRNILSVCRFPILVGSGVDPETKLEIGPNTYFCIREPTGKLYYIENSGGAVALGRQDLEDLKSEMAMMGLQLLMPQTGTQTATAKAMDGAEANCGLQALVLGFQSVLNEAIHIMADWIDDPDTQDSILINSEFGLTLGATQDIMVLMTARGSREISHEAFIAELKRRGLLPIDFDVDTDQKLLDTEAAAAPAQETAGTGFPPKKDAAKPVEKAPVDEPTTQATGG